MRFVSKLLRCRNSLLAEKLDLDKALELNLVFKQERSKFKSQFLGSKFPFWTPDIESFVVRLREDPQPACCPFQEAELWAVVEYTRGSKHLKLPESLKSVLPSFEMPDAGS